jgi:integrase
MSEQHTCIKILNHLLSQHASKRVNGNVASHLTSSSYGAVLTKCFSQLHKLGYKLQDPRNIGEKHIEALCRFWLESGRKASTMQSELSKLRIFCGWIGKAGMVKNLVEILPDVDRARLKSIKVAKKSKSWSENGIDVTAKIREGDELDWRFGLMLRMSLAFGLRRKEAVQLKPWKSDKGEKLAVYEAKNGRPRDVYIDTPEQRAVLDYVKSKIVSKSGFLGWETTERGEKATLEYSIGRYNRSMAKIGITKNDVDTSGHGLRAQFAENAALIANMIPPTLGGTRGQMDREDLNVKRAQVSELLGHSRISITASYYGSFGREATLDEAGRCKKNIEKAVQQCPSTNFKPVLADRLDDCTKLLTELAQIDVEITARQVQMLWEVHSQRHAGDWIKPLNGNAEALEAAALKIFKQQQIPLPEIG